VPVLQGQVGRGTPRTPGHERSEWPGHTGGQAASGTRRVCHCDRGPPGPSGGISPWRYCVHAAMVPAAAHVRAATVQWGHAMKPKNTDPRTLVTAYASSLIENMLSTAVSLHKLEHDVSKGTLRELLVSGALKKFLSAQFGVSSGIVVNQDGQQSPQTDIIVFDNRILPPFIQEQGVGVVPAESVVALIEVKSNLDSASICGSDKKRGADESARLTLQVCSEVEPRPYACVFAFYQSGLPELRDRDKGKVWLDQHANNLDAVVLAGEYSWIKMKDHESGTREWRGGFANTGKDTSAHEATKRFFAVLLDNCRTKGEARYRKLTQAHEDFLSKYIRDQGLSQQAQPPHCAPSDMSNYGDFGPAPTWHPDSKDKDDPGAQSTPSSLID